MRPKRRKFPVEEVDLEVVNRQPTPEELEEISAFIRADKEKRKRSVSRPPRTVKA